MLTAILNALKGGKIYSLQELADMLKTNIPVVKARLEYLERRGYIKKVVLNTGCGKSCHGCKGRGPKASASAYVMWELTPEYSKSL